MRIIIRGLGGSIYGAMIRLTMCDAEFLVIEQMVILGKPELTLALLAMLDPIIPYLDVLEPFPPPVVTELVVLVNVPEINVEDGEDEDLDNDKELEIVLKEPDQMDEDDIEKGQIIEHVADVVPGLATEIAQIAAIWDMEMAAQRDGIITGEVELVEAIMETITLVVTVEATQYDIKDDIDDDVQDNVVDNDFIMLEDLDDEIDEIIPNEMTFGPNDEIPPYELGVEDLWARMSRLLILSCLIGYVVHFLMFQVIATDHSLVNFICLEAYFRVMY